ncbi:TPA: hypothetical protein MIO32_25805 [Klebsiella variicola]|nr:hypothetical protein [Klebsiella variicola]
MQTEEPADKAALKQSQKENKSLKKGLVRKDKTLAEAAAILVLRKKLTDYYEETDGEDCSDNYLDTYCSNYYSV